MLMSLVPAAWPFCRQAAEKLVIGHKRALALPAYQKPLLYQVQHGLAHGYAAYAVGVAQELLTGDARPGGIDPGEDVVFQPCHELLVQRALALFLQRFVLHVVFLRHSIPKKARKPVS